MANKKIYLSPKIIYDRLSEKVIGQDKVKKAVANAVFMHYLKTYRLYALDKPYGPKSNVLIVGPTGAGKTHVMKTLEDILPEIPVLHLDATALTNYGFQGNSLESMLIDWKKNEGEAANFGIVFIDEVDKLCAPVQTNKHEDWNKTLQQGILKIVEGTVVREGGRNIDTSNVLFIFGGNFSELRKRLFSQLNRRGIGFKAEKPLNIDLSRIHSELVQTGLIQELAGRISTIVEVKELTRKDLKRILRDPHGPYYNYKDLFSILDESLNLSEYYMDKIIDICLVTKTGARGLQTALDEILEDKIFNIPDIDFTPEPENKE